jgi:hypothetical protein
MPPSDQPEDVLEHLRESGGSDATMRQLRRRYDLLREDYEALIDRLGELEDRLAARGISTSSEEPRTLLESMAAPLVRLRDEYHDAAAAIQRIIEGLEGLARGTMKGQRTSRPAAPAEPPPASQEEASGPPSPAPAAAPETPAPEPEPEPLAPGVARTPVVPRPRPAERVQVDVKGTGFGDLLDFQEQLSQLPGVARVSINAIDNERATLIVELSSAE